MSLPYFARAAAATTPALCLTRRAYSTAFGRSPGCLASKHKTSSPTDYDRDEDEEEDEDDEMRRVQIFRPPMSAEEQKRRRATSRFLAQLLTTADEQEWRDMLAAALRCGTWKEHHTLALLRGVHASRYDTMPAAAEEEEVNDEEDNRRDEKNEVKKEETAAAARQGRGRAHTSHTPVTSSSTSSTRAAMPSQRRSTATQRLRRVRDVVQFCLEEGIRAEESSNSSSNSSSTDDGGGCVVYHPQDSTVHSLLVHTLRAACYPVGTSSHPSQSASSSTTTTGSNTNNNTPLQPSQEHTAHEAETTTPQHDHAATAVGQQRQLHEDENNTQGEQGVVCESEAGRQSSKTGMADRSHTQRAMPDEEDAEHSHISNTASTISSISSSGSTAHEHTTSDTVGSTSPPASAMALACYGEVWSLLAWMERHGYHPQSFRVLDELERLVDTEDEAGALQQQGIGRADGALAAGGGVGGRHQRRPGTRRVAMAMSHIHRTEYLRRERDWLKEELERRARAEAEGEAHRASTGSGAIASSHKTAARPGSAPRPRPEPQTR